MKLYLTPLSHFSRKVRLVLDFYEVEYESINIGNVVDSNTHQFANNPLMTIPVLVDKDVWIIESDHIAAYLSQKIDPSDKLNILTNKIFDLNTRAILNGIMSNEVKIILAQRTKIPIEQYTYFEKSKNAILQGMQWLETQADQFTPHNISYRELHFLCAWDHLNNYELIDRKPLIKLNKIANLLSEYNFVKKSAPPLKLNSRSSKLPQ